MGVVSAFDPLRTLRARHCRATVKRDAGGRFLTVGAYGRPYGSRGNTVLSWLRSLQRHATYSGVAGAGMAAGEYLETPSALRGDWKTLVQAALLWMPLATLIAGLVYLLALLF